LSPAAPRLVVPPREPKVASFWRENSKGLQTKLDAAEEQLFKWKTRCEKAERDLKTREGEWESSRVNLVRQRDDELAHAAAAEKDADRYRTERDDARRDWEAREDQVEELTSSKEQLRPAVPS
jgi:chromosome segregation ATPase